MNQDETTQEESIDQPDETSTPDETQEESQDQPSTEVEEDDTESEESIEDQPEDSDAIVIDGETYTPEEAKELLEKGKHFTYNMQQVREKERLLEQAAQQPKQPKTLSPEEEEVINARQTLKKYGVVMEDEVDARIRASQTEHQLSTEFGNFQKEYKVDPEIAALVRVAGNAYNMSYKDAYEKFWLKGKRPTKRKMVGVSKKAQNSVSTKGGGGVPTRQELNDMPRDKFKKLNDSGQIDAWLKDGLIK